MLSIGSAVFDAMFNGGFSGSTEHATTACNVASCTRCVQEIKLPDIEPNAFLALLKFLYCDEVAVGPDNVMTVLYTGNGRIISIKGNV